MANLTLGKAPFDKHGLGIELSEMSKSRSPSSSSRQHVFNADDDKGPLIDETTGRRWSAQSRGPTDELPSSRWRQKRRWQGWRFGVAASATLAFVVLMINALFVIIASARSVVEGGIGTLYDGDCSYVHQTTVWLHVAINILSSLLLGASNYTMQALSSPTRAEVDKAHSKGDWVDIGIPSFRNIWGRISGRRTFLWWVIGLSSVPIHLLYNSAVFKAIDTNTYQPMLVNSRFFDGEPFDYNVTQARATDAPDPYMGYYDTDEAYNNIRAQQKWFIDNRESSAVQRMSNAECIATYGSSFVSGYSDVLLITPHEGQRSNQTVFWAPPLYISPNTPGSEWICFDLPGFRLQSCDIATAKRNAESWTIKTLDIESCLARVAPSHCKLQYSQAILITVILMNCAKVAAMLWTYLYEGSVTLVTVGDAIANYLDRPDELTVGRCLMASKDVDRGPLKWRSKQDTSHDTYDLDPIRSRDGVTSAVQQRKKARFEPNVQPNPQTFDGTFRRRWFSAASSGRWTVAILLLCSALVSVSVLLALGLTKHAIGLDTPAQGFQLGFGKVNPYLLIHSDLPESGPEGLLAAVLLANTPQAILSFIYLAYNGLFTCMLLSEEWSRYFLRPKPLRVTTPHGQQRSNYYLHLPFSYSIPLLAGSALLHWLLSESIFLARIDLYDHGVLDSYSSASRTGYSPLAILLLVATGSIMLVVLVGHGFRRLSSPMPVTGSCSVAIAAACHRPREDEDAAYLPVAWGAIQGPGDVGHCTFTSEQVYEPVQDGMYAGECSAFKW